MEFIKYRCFGWAATFIDIRFVHGTEPTGVMTDMFGFAADLCPLRFGNAALAELPEDHIPGSEDWHRLSQRLQREPHDRYRRSRPCPPGTHQEDPS